MKSPPAATDCDDMFGPPRTYATGFCAPKQRPSMISAKYRQKEERRKVLKISINKLKRIEDPESSLCRSVLINNTMRRLQREARDEKLNKHHQQQQLHYPRYYDDSFLGLKSADSLSADAALEFEIIEPEIIDAKIADEISVISSSETVRKNLDDVLSDFVDDNLANIEVATAATATAVSVTTTTTATTITASSTESDTTNDRKRTYDEVEDCDVQDVLSQFYMPPTPRMLTHIDDDEDVNVVDIEPPSPKRLKLEDAVDADDTDLSLPSLPDDDDDDDNTVKATCDVELPATARVTFTLNNNIPDVMEDTSRLRYTASATTSDTSDTASSASSSPYSCGHASMFNDMQNNVFHSLIASLET